MNKKIKITNKIDIESNTDLFYLIKEILNQKLSSTAEFIAWRDHLARYIDPTVIHRKKDIQEFERRFEAEFFEILYVLHLIVYLTGKKMLGSTGTRSYQEISEPIFENVFEQVSPNSKFFISCKIDALTKTIQQHTLSTYEQFEKLYRKISPKEIRKPLGEYFTPYELADKMVSEVSKKYKDGKWLDNSSGFGVFYLSYLKAYGSHCAKNFTCIDVNPLSVFISKVIILLEFRELSDELTTTHIVWGDTLLNEKYAYKNGKITVTGNFDHLHHSIGVIIGNPPWVSWKSMTKEYQRMIGEDWRSYGIFDLAITRKTLAACNDDLSSYFVYYSLDKFLKDGGMLKYIINLSLFKSNLVGKEFRKYYIQKNDTSFQVEKIYDLSDYKVFPGVTNSYCVFDAIKGRKTTFPIPYFLVSQRKGGKLQITETGARPVKNLTNGALITINGNDQHFNLIEGVCEYKARAGVCTWLNSVYWVEKLEPGDDITVIRNLWNNGKKKVHKIETKVESELLFKLLRARNLDDFIPMIENCIIIPQRKDDLSKPIHEFEMQEKFENSYEYFKYFEKELKERSGYKKFLKGQPYYGLYNIGPYTRSPIKLGWQFVSKKFQVFLITDAEDIIPDLNVMFIPLSNLDEAYYLHALLNSKYARQKIESSTNWTFPSGSIQKLYLEKFNPLNEIHRSLAELQKNSLLGADSVSTQMDTLFKEYWFNGRGKKTEQYPVQLSFL